LLLALKAKLDDCSISDFFSSHDEWRDGRETNFRYLFLRVLGEKLLQPTLHFLFEMV